MVVAGSKNCLPLTRPIAAETVDHPLRIIENHGFVCSFDRVRLLAYCVSQNTVYQRASPGFFQLACGIDARGHGGIGRNSHVADLIYTAHKQRFDIRVLWAEGALEQTGESSAQ